MQSHHILALTGQLPIIQAAMLSSTIMHNVIQTGTPGCWTNKVLSEPRLLMLVGHMFIGQKIRGSHISYHCTLQHETIQQHYSWRIFINFHCSKIFKTSSKKNCQLKFWIKFWGKGMRPSKSGDPANRGPVNWGMNVIINKIIHNDASIIASKL